MPSAVEIVNLALARIGQGAPIASLDEEGEPASQAKAVLPFARDDVLRAYAWPFATRRVSLAIISGVDATPWGYAYRVPSDCVRVTDLPVSTSVEAVPFEIGGDDSGGLILTDLTPATLRYVTRVENLSLWPSQVAGVLAWYLAAELATTIARDGNRADAMRARARVALSEAVAWAAGEAQASPEPTPHFIAART
jgi:hypothetical protein